MQYYGLNWTRDGYERLLKKWAAEGGAPAV